MAKTIVVKQIGSPIRRPAKQRQTLIGLGLNKMHKTRELEDTPSVRGMVNKISHMVEIIEERDYRQDPIIVTKFRPPQLCLGRLVLLCCIDPSKKDR